jgi:hypothetical protein
MTAATPDVLASVEADNENKRAVLASLKAHQTVLVSGALFEDGRRAELENEGKLLDMQIDEQLGIIAGIAQVPSTDLDAAKAQMLAAVERQVKDSADAQDAAVKAAEDQAAADQKAAEDQAAADATSAAAAVDVSTLLDTPVVAAVPTPPTPAEIVPPTPPVTPTVLSVDTPTPATPIPPVPAVPATDAAKGA